MCPDRSQGKAHLSLSDSPLNMSVTGRSATLSPASSATTCLDSSATMCPDSSAEMCHPRSAATCPASSAATCRGSSVSRSLNRSVTPPSPAMATASRDHHQLLHLPQHSRHSRHKSFSTTLVGLEVCFLVNPILCHLPRLPELFISALFKYYNLQRTFSIQGNKF